MVTACCDIAVLEQGNTRLMRQHGVFSFRVSGRLEGIWNCGVPFPKMFGVGWKLVEVGVLFICNKSFIFFLFFAAYVLGLQWKPSNKNKKIACGCFIYSTNYFFFSGATTKSAFPQHDYARK